MSDKGYRVSNENGRTPPGDPWSIALTYRHQHYWWFSADDAPETWHVSADIDDGSGPHSGDLDITLVDAYQTRDPFALLDGQDAELGHIAGTLFDAGDGRLDPDLDEQLEPAGSRLLILHSVKLAPEWRGFGLGALLAGTAIAKLSGGARAAVCYPAPLNEQTDAGPDNQGEAEWDKATAALQQVWARLGFKHFRDGAHVLDLSLVTLDEKLGQLRENAGRYRTFQD
jgi:GNAT superfamily N-acetyltransferase